MARSQDLYRAVCGTSGREALTDAEIHKIVLFLQRSFRQPRDAVDLEVGQIVHIDPDSTQG